MRNKRVFAVFWLAAFVVPGMTLAQYMERFQAVFFHQEGSGLRVVGIGSDTTRKQVGTFLRLKNYAYQRVVGFEIAFVASGDVRLQPDTAAGPEVVKRSGYIETAIDPGAFHDVYNLGPNFDEFIPRLRKDNVRFGILRAGVSRVVYADGSEQNFDLLKDEQARKSTPPPDMGGHPNPTKKPISMNPAWGPRILPASFRTEAQPCRFQVDAIPAGEEGSWLYSDSKSVPISLSFEVGLARPPKPTPSGCSFSDCSITCLNPPACDIWGGTCTPSSYDCMPSTCITYYCHW
jgi:hypothetical protein